MCDFETGEKVYWRDMEDKNSGVYKILEKTGEYAYHIGNGVIEIEVCAGEIFELHQRVQFRKWAFSGEVIAIFPEQELDDMPKFVASFQIGDDEKEAEYDFVMEATIATGKNEYEPLLKELKEHGYDALEVIVEKVDMYKLLGTMDLLAQKLIPSIMITDFTVHDRKAITESNMNRKFIWQVRNSGTYLYFMDEPDWKKRLSERIESYKIMNKENLYYMYDGEDFYPVYKETVLELIK